MSNNIVFTKVFPSTSSAVEGYKASAGADASPYRVVDVNVNLAGATTSSVFILGDALPAGSFVVQAGVNVQGLDKPVQEVFNLNFYNADLGGTQTAAVNGSPSNFLATVSTFTVPAATQNNLVGTVAVPTVPAWVVGPSNGLYPVYLGLTPTTLPVLPQTETGVLHVKVVVFSPSF